VEEVAMKLQKIKTKYLVVGFVLLGILCLWMDFSSSKTEKEKPAKASVDTYIPHGMTLVPIEIQNIESLKNILGNYGVVDLYIPSLDPKIAPKKVASHVKILRAPLNPDVFAVLVREQDAPRIASQSAAFFVTIQNPKNQKAQFNGPTKTTHIITEM
jgi:hypothetical protein